MSMLMSPVFEPTVSEGIFSDSPCPWKVEAMDRVLLNVLSEGSRQAMSDSVMVDGLMLPVYFSEGETKCSPLNL